MTDKAYNETIDISATIAHAQLDALQKVSDHIDTWIEALRINANRAKVNGHYKQEEALRDSIEAYWAVQYRIIATLRERIRETAGMKETGQ